MLRLLELELELVTLLELELELEPELEHIEAYIPGARAAFIKLHFTVTPHDLVLASYSHPILLVARLSHIRWHAAAEAADHGRPFQAETHE